MSPWSVETILTTEPHAAGPAAGSLNDVVGAAAGIGAVHSFWIGFASSSSRMRHVLIHREARVQGKEDVPASVITRLGEPAFHCFSSPELYPCRECSLVCVALAVSRARGGPPDTP